MFSRRATASSNDFASYQAAISASTSGMFGVAEGPERCHVFHPLAVHIDLSPIVDAFNIFLTGHGEATGCSENCRSAPIDMFCLAVVVGFADISAPPDVLLLIVSP